MRGLRYRGLLMVGILLLLAIPPAYIRFGSRLRFSLIEKPLWKPVLNSSGFVDWKTHNVTQVHNHELRTLSMEWTNAPIETCRNLHYGNLSVDFAACSLDFKPELGDASDYVLYWPLISKEECEDPGSNRDKTLNYSLLFPNVYKSIESCLNAKQTPFRLGDKLLAIQDIPESKGFPFRAKLLYARNVVLFTSSFMSPDRIWTPSDVPFAGAFVNDALGWHRNEVINVSNMDRYDMVVSISRAWGDATTHWHADTLPRLIPLLPELIKHKWHLFLVTSEVKRMAYVRRWLDFLGADNVPLLNSSEPVYALEAYRATSDAQDGSLFGASLVLFRLQRERVIARTLVVRPDLLMEPATPYVLCVMRTKGAKRENDRTDEAPMREIAEALEKRGIVVKFARDDDKALMDCIPCQVALFYHASAVLGFQGAGLVFAMYMQPGRILCQMGVDVPYFVSLAMAIGLRHIAPRNMATNELADLITNDVKKKH